mmetsp:Transcript_7251/g.9182  ORF Transcript_7251/g.9182 Transcript_7251/m.9182 type:complete len:394 (+) Transcript_7251:264-1445(+)|eukprot:CAMPEP_0204835420 /NCGR_PEP_ID=MMETSP1346-20131115/22588_1 /ASSEMBLY_ACC=CAM_ASM_000771 /TAXON_ID=215587 /ORGANISM="Aplanochytrium stocchinoi, Strain GSBS06" /LENGTH=393 /DNA_ID=CAMNT_0051969431 /DNA_START=233 /DNA_END=1414 /DNA_ORIENTATION=-
MGNGQSSKGVTMEGTGLGGTGPSKSDKSTDKKVGKAIVAKAKAEKSRVKLLLLGAGESGKTTVLKQMTILHGGGFSEKYKQEMKPKICFNIIEGCEAIVKAAGKFGNKFESDDAQRAAEIVLDKKNKVLGSSAQIDDELADAVLLLQKDAAFQKTLESRSKFQIQESWDEFAKRLSKYPTWGGNDWLPSVEDILLARVRTTGIVDQTFNIDGVQFQIIDVGGQRSERRKWMGLFGGVTGLIFVAALSEYDQVLFEHSGTNRLVESLKLWETNANRPDFKDSALLLFLNKFDLFQQKYYEQKVPIGYDGEFVKEDPANNAPPTWDNEKDNKCEIAINWFKRLFLHQVSADRVPLVYIHVTTALDPSNMETVIAACASHILQQNMKRSGLVPAFV